MMYIQIIQLRAADICSPNVQNANNSFAEGMLRILLRVILSD